MSLINSCICFRSRCFLRPSHANQKFRGFTCGLPSWSKYFLKSSSPSGSCSKLCRFFAHRKQAGGESLSMVVVPHEPSGSNPKGAEEAS